MSLLKCPSCGNTNLHHEQVVVCNRAGEDKPGVRVDVNRLSVTTQADVPDRAFAGRRDDIRIRFRCEQCPAVSWLYIIQHKGDTILKWLEGDARGSVYDKSPQVILED